VKVIIFFRLILVLILITALVFTASCAPEDVEQIKGIVKSVDVVNGKITIVTEDGKEVTLSLDSETQMEGEEGSLDIETLKAGVPVQVDLDEEEQVVKSIITGNGKESEADDSSDEEAGAETGTESETGEAESGKETEDGKSTGDEKNAEGGTDTSGDTGTKDDSEKDGEGAGSGGSEGDVKEASEEEIEGLINEMEAERERLAEEIRVRTAEGNVDEEWVKEVEAERARLAEEIRKIQEGEYRVVVIDGKVVAVTPEDPKGETGTDEGDSSGDNGDGHPDDGDGHPDDGDGHPEDGDDHPDDGDGHPDDGEDDHHE